MAEDDFQKQLELEALEKQKEEQGDWNVPNSSYVDPNDGTVYEWDSLKRAWFPKVDDNFFAAYQANYEYKTEEETAGTQSSADNSQQGNTVTQAEPDGKGKRKATSEPAWFEVDDAHNTNVYVSGLPMDTTEEEFVELMSKCGLIMKDPDTMKYKIKLYRNPDGTLKGDARCCYIKVESVGLALDILDGYLHKGNEIHVERAQFELKGAYDPRKKPRKKRAKDKEKLKKKLDKLFDWRPDKLRGQRLKHERTVVIKNMFDPKEFEDDASLILDYQKDVREECSKCGEVKKVVIYDRHPEGVVSVTFAEPEMADECINLMNGRWFAARQLTAETWDGKTRYKIVETEEERQKRLQEWDKFLEGEPGSKVSDKSSTSVACNQSSGVPDKDPEPVTSSSKTVYEQAGETDSSGESGDEQNVSVPCVSNNSIGPVMTSRGTLEFSAEPSKLSSSVSNCSD